MKKLVLALFIMTLTMVSFGQKLSVSAGPSVSFPVGKLHDSYRNGFGGVVQATYTPVKTHSFTLSGGYTYYDGKETGRLRQIPVLAGVRSNYIGKNSIVYLGLSGGVSFYSVHNPGDDASLFDKAYFTYSPSVGMEFKKIVIDGRLVSSVSRNSNSDNSLFNGDFFFLENAGVAVSLQYKF